MVWSERSEREVMTMDVHQDLLEILCAFDNVCSRHDIRYSLHGGTMLGAVREHGFIPWDDDADIAMTRENYNKLITVLDANYPEYSVKGRIKKQFYRNGNDQVWTDIFICDYISENNLLRKVKLLLLTLLDIMYRDRESMKLSNLQKYSRGKRLLYRTAFLAGQLFPKKWISNCYGFVSEKCFLGNKENLFRSNDQYIGRKLVFPSAWMRAYQYIPFENVVLPVCEESHALLIQSYGENYMTPVQEERNTEVHNLVRSVKQMNL